VFYEFRHDTEGKRVGIPGQSNPPFQHDHHQCGPWHPVARQVQCMTWYSSEVTHGYSRYRRGRTNIHQLGLRDLWSLIGLLAKVVTNLDRLDRLSELDNELAVDPRLDKDMCTSAATLAVVPAKLGKLDQSLRRQHQEKPLRLSDAMHHYLEL
jgi:hypothetical protein